jgi:DNA-binding MarR family transcriptional regulator
MYLNYFLGVLEMEEKTLGLSEAARKQLLANSDRRYDFVETYNNYMKIARDYGTGETINMVEVHTLTLIEQNPGIMAKEVAAMWHRTKGAVSQTLAKLEKRGFIERCKAEGDGRNFHLYVTAAGQKLSKAHRNYDMTHLLYTDTTVHKTCTDEEIECFYKVLDQYTQAIKEQIK